jgi:hypothetical protein
MDLSYGLTGDGATDNTAAFIACWPTAIEHDRRSDNCAKFPSHGDPALACSRESRLR